MPFAIVILHNPQHEIAPCSHSKVHQYVLNVALGNVQPPAAGKEHARTTCLGVQCAIDGTA
jgi:hypothetical protein